jgi:aldose 1-epimerase
MIIVEHFGQTPDGQDVERYSLINRQNMRVDILTYGAIIQRWIIADNEPTDIVLGFDQLDSYINDPSYIGRTVGRYANRIANGQFELSGNRYQVSTNLGEHSLHGGKNGFSARIWQAKVLSEEHAPSLELSLISEDGDQGFPGKLLAKTTFTLTETNSLHICYEAESDQDTLFNPTQHSYFNLAGHNGGHIGQQVIIVNADKYTPAPELSIPTGELADVQNSAFDLRQPQPFETSLRLADPEIKLTNGLDHNWCVNGFSVDAHGIQNSVNRAAEVYDPNSGRRLIVNTSMPGIQVYTANFIGEDLAGKADAVYATHHAFCLETQFYPDAPNQKGFPSAELKKGMKFRSTTEYIVE